MQSLTQGTQFSHPPTPLQPLPRGCRAHSALPCEQQQFKHVLPTARGQGTPVPVPVPMPVPAFLLKAAYLVTNKRALDERAPKVNCGSRKHEWVTGLFPCSRHKSLGLSFLFLSLVSACDK